MSVGHSTGSLRNRALAVLSGLMLVTGLAGINPLPSALAAGGTVHMIVHYWRPDGAYTAPGTCSFADSPNVTTCGWNLWIWDFSGGGAGAGFSFTGTDSYGVVADLNIPCTVCTTMGYIVRHSLPGSEWDAKDTVADRHLPITNGTGEVWVVAGDPTDYFTLQAALNARAPRIDAANLDGPKTVTVGMSTDFALNGGTDGFKVMDSTTHTNLAAKSAIDGHSYPGLHAVVAGTFQQQLGGTNWDPNSTKTRMKQINPDLYQFETDLPAGDYSYRVAVGGSLTTAYPAANVDLALNGTELVDFWYIPYENQVYDSINNDAQPKPPNDPGFKTNLITVTLKKAPNIKDALSITAPNITGAPVIPRYVLNGSQYYYSGNLGATYSKASTAFDVWAPTASAVSLELFNSETGAMTRSVPMSAIKGGAWQAIVTGDLKGWYYLYAVTIAGVTKTGVDPYARGIAVNGTRAMVVDLPGTNPKGWSSDRHVGVANPVDATVYEADVRDFSIDSNSGVPVAHRGKYLAFTDHGTKGPGAVSTGIDSVKQLGAHDIELMPTYTFASVDETNPTQQNWGYDPRNYNVPEGQYATNPHGTARIAEYKRMVKSIHNSGMGVIFDGVYSHVADAGTFNPFVNEYYLRTDNFGNYIGGSGAGPDVAIDRPMVERFVEDSMKYWVQEYHIDGFRLDWMSLYGRSSLTKISNDLHKVFPGIVIFGEPWESGGDEVPGGLFATQQVTEANFAAGHRVPGVGLLDDWFRNPLCCGAFDTNAGYGDGAPHGTASAPVTIDDKLGVQQAVVGETQFSPGIHGFTSDPSQTLNYASNHDGYTLWDRINDFSDKTETMPTKIAMDELTEAIVLTSQGIPEILSGEEMLRTK
ncbi:MAG TPA: pullulanase-associated domain-containing protein, partial [Chloroflexota bacterium]|nr:pullulanase-associated domain-containing protein [Chloroflexota bacterium]